MRVLSVSAPIPAVPAGVVQHAQKVARNDALNIDAAGRKTMLESACEELEAYLGRLVWQGARTVTTVAAVDTLYAGPVPLMPRFPDVTGVTIGSYTVEVWRDGAWQAAAVTLRPLARVELPAAPAEYRFTVPVEVDAAPTAPMLEAVARVFAIRTSLRPGDQDLSQLPVNLSGAWFKSGAAECVRHLRRVI